MDELQLLANVLGGPDQSDDAIDQARHRLQNAMRGGSARRRRIGWRVGWLAGGLGLTGAAATAAVVVIVSSTTVPADKPHAPPAADPHRGVRLSGRQILLAAASTALTAPAGSGKYWYIKTIYTKGGGRDSIETWVGLDGRSWVRQGSPNSPLVHNDGDNGHFTDGFDVADSRLTYRQIQQLPTDPAVLKTWIAGHSEASVPTSMREMLKIGVLVGLLSGVPAPPKVRAAAFRLLAAVPGVKSLGPVQGGQGLKLPDPLGQNMLVVNLTTAQVHGLSSDVIDGKKITGSETVVAAEWTNTLPQ